MSGGEGAGPVSRAEVKASAYSIMGALVREAQRGPSEKQLDAAPAALVARCATPQLLAQLYPWGERRHFRPRMVRALVRQLVAAGLLATDADLDALPDMAWVWSPAHASGPGTRPDEADLDRLTPPHPEPADDPATDDDEATEVEAPPPSDPLPVRDRNRTAREVGPKTEDVRRLGLRALRAEGALYPEQPGVDYHRPRTRGECADVPRPCPFVSCRHHLYLDVKETGAIRYNFPDLEPGEVVHSCALDVADRGAADTYGDAQSIVEHVSVVGVADLLNLTRERVWQVEGEAFEKVKAAGGGLLARHLDGRRRLPLLDRGAA